MTLPSSDTPPPTPPSTLEDAAPELQEAVARLRESPAVQGVLLVGSRSRGFHEGKSDFDLEVVVDDEFYAALPRSDRIALVWDGKPFKSRLLGDIYTEGRSAFAAKQGSPLDVDHWPYEAAQLWYDREGAIAPLVAALAAFPEEIWEPRLKLHYVDSWYHAARATKLAERGSTLNQAMVLQRAVQAALQWIFVLNQRWPPLPHWAEQALQHSALPHRPPDDLALLGDALSSNSAAPLRQLHDHFDALLAAHNLSWHTDRLALLIEVFGPDFREARERWQRY